MDEKTYQDKGTLSAHEMDEITYPILMFES
jgi:hypothetical protein